MVLSRLREGSGERAGEGAVKARESGIDGHQCYGGERSGWNISTSQNAVREDEEAQAQIKGRHREASLDFCFARKIWRVCKKAAWTPLFVTGSVSTPKEGCNDSEEVGRKEEEAFPNLDSQQQGSATVGSG
jgi:hypothetical protein